VREKEYPPFTRESYKTSCPSRDKYEKYVISDDNSMSTRISIAREAGGTVGGLSVTCCPVPVTTEISD
jgi:hypothetical protein